MKIASYSEFISLTTNDCEVAIAHGISIILSTVDCAITSIISLITSVFITEYAISVSIFLFAMTTYFVGELLIMLAGGDIATRFGCVTGAVVSDTLGMVMIICFLFKLLNLSTLIIDSYLTDVSGI